MCIRDSHVGVYKSKKDNNFKRADHPAYLLRNSIVSASLLAGIWNAKYITYLNIISILMILIKLDGLL